MCKLLTEPACIRLSHRASGHGVTRMPLKNGRRRGAALIEAAIVFGLLLLMITGGLDFALQLHVRHRMTGASREAARALAVKKGTTAQATTAALNQLKGINATFTVSFPAPSDPDDIKVQISVPRRQISLGFFSGPKGAAITTETTMRKEI